MDMLKGACWYIMVYALVRLNNCVESMGDDDGRIEGCGIL